jgi:hypothetical protein
MKTLNRPMFKYGGPIKEGIMNGMQDRPGYSIGSLVTGAGTALMAGLRSSPKFLKNIYQGFRGGKYISPFDSGITKTQRFRNIFPTGNFRSTTPTITRTKQRTVPNASGTYSPINIKPGEKLGFMGTIKDPKRIGAAIAENPGLAISSPSLLYSAGEIGGPVVGSTLKGIANFLVPGTRFDPFGPKEDDIKTTEGTGIKRGDPNKNKNVGTVNAGGTGGKSDAEKQIINEDRINETKQKYYKLMGIDKMNKDAVYDSLIDASKIISEEGGDLKGSIKSGTLQNRIIQAISGQLDKSTALKRQIDAAVLKGEIEKDIKQSDPSNEIADQLRLLQAKKLKKDLEGSSAADVLATAEIQGKNLVTSNTLTSILSSKGTNVDFTFPDDKYQKWEKNNKTKDEIDYLTENYGSLDDGLYVVNKKAVQVKDGSATFVDLDKITG